MTEPETDSEGYFPTGPASVCVEAPPQRQCYTAPDEFGRTPKVIVVQLQNGKPALFFSAASGGVSGFRIHFALLRPGSREGLENLLISDASVSNQSQTAFWNDPSISDSAFFVTADFVWGPDQSHDSPHRYIISAFVEKHSSDLKGSYYYLEDRYMTARSYDRETGDDILASERQEIVTRLRQFKVEADSRRAPPIDLTPHDREMP